MQKRYRYGIIGTGRPRRAEGSTGFGMAHAHARAFRETGRCDLIAIADLSQENAVAFAAEYGRPSVYRDYERMLAEEKLDIVCICTWPHLHAPMAAAAAQAGARAVHCEKPMATTWGDARRMHEACVERGVQLTFNHQRRFLEPFQTARRMLLDGVVGDLQRLEGQCGDMYDWGTHWLDMFFFYNGEAPARWVIGQIDSRTERKVFGVPVEDQGICHVAFQNDVRGTLVTGHEASMGCANRLIGTEGVIEVGWDKTALRVRARGDADWRVVPTTEGIHDDAAHGRVAADIVRCLDTGERPLLSSYHAIQATEVIFATYESSRRRGRVDLPLQSEDSALLAMLAEGVVGPNAAR